MKTTYFNFKNFVRSFICTRLKDECDETSGTLFREKLSLHVLNFLHGLIRQLLAFASLYVEDLDRAIFNRSFDPIRVLSNN